MELLREGAKSLGLTLSAGHLAQFERYYQELSAWNQRFNLTAITGYPEVQLKHFLDSLSCLLALPHAAETDGIPSTVPLQWGERSLWCLDVGSGAGFPGLPLKIMLPEAEMTLIEATGKKVAFLRHIVGVLGLKQVQVIHGRAEDVAHLPEHRERYDVVVARAVAQMPALAEYCLPFCRPGGRLVAQKGDEAPAEAEAARGALETLGGWLVEVKPLELPGLEAARYLVVVDKVAKTPELYPRRAGIPAKRPLG
jgi:16S rRNA (guanine527-N7)-methyltransferase